ncbi:hypothetical protein ACFLQ8_00535 [Candidatus Auribacterota bacterium]
MKKKNKDSNRPIGKMTRIKDVLPLPDKLVVPERIQPDMKKRP